jgi:hypothetical protein
MLSRNDDDDGGRYGKSTYRIVTPDCKVLCVVTVCLVTVQATQRMSSSFPFIYPIVSLSSPT